MSSSYRFRSETIILDEQARREAPGKFIKLTDGYVHYQLGGPVGAQTVVLVHGFSVPYYIWDHTFPALVEAGFQVLRYDLYGRGFSDRPDVVYDPGLFDRQLFELLEALDLKLAVDLVGLSLGGPITTGFAARHPECVRRLALVDPAGFVKQPFLAKIIKIQGMGERFFDWFGDRMLTSEQFKDFREPEKFLDYPPKYLPQMKYQGFKRALLSTLRHFPTGGWEEVFQQVGKQGRAVLLIWGREDRTVPFEQHELVRRAIPQLEFHVIEHAGHIPHYERPEVVNPILIRFFKQGG